MFSCCSWLSKTGYLSSNGCLLLLGGCLYYSWLKILKLESRHDEMLILLQKNRHQINSIDINAYK